MSARTPISDGVIRPEAGGCTCPWAIRNLGTLYGVSMGKGWVRLSTEKSCALHGEPVDSISGAPLHGNPGAWS